MLNFLRDKLHTAGLRARYQRLVHERLLDLTEAEAPQPVAEDPGGWHLVGETGSAVSDTKRTDARTQARQLVTRNPHARNILRLLESYVTGPGLKLEHRLTTEQPDASEQPASLNIATTLWRQFLHENARHFTYREFARRCWRDGETFLRKFDTPAWPPAVRFVDPEAIGPTPQHPDSQGILTDPRDVEQPHTYLRINPASGELVEQIDAADILHTRIGVDSNQKRGLTIFLPVQHTLDCFDKWVETELLARKLQSSIVLWRKVQGSPSNATAFADQAAAANPPRLAPSLNSGRQERVRPGTILTTNHGTEIQFLQPNTNFGDAVPLGRMLLLNIAAGAGLPEFMLTSDASNANFASTMVAEGPAVKFFQSEQQFFTAAFTRLWHWVMQSAVAAHLLPADFFDHIEPAWSFPELVNRDRPRERLADVRLVEQHILSRAEIARRDGVDPTTMQSEIATELRSAEHV